MHFSKLKASTSAMLNTDDMWQLKGHIFLNFLPIDMESY